jgi:iron-sulfur cluster assembly accessory protein
MFGRPAGVESGGRRHVHSMGAAHDGPVRDDAERRSADRRGRVKVKSLLEQEGQEDLRLRVAVQPGGCSGLRYQLFFDDRQLDGDIVRDFGGVDVVTDRMSAPYLTGATIDFVDTIEQQGFTIDNPNATNSCACGDSFH